MADGEGEPSLAKWLPALLLIGSLLAVIVATLALVGARESDIESLTRGAPKRTLVGASLMVLAVITAGVGAVFTTARAWFTVGGYAAALIGLVFYLSAAIYVTSDPPAPSIKIEPLPQTEETKVTATVSGLAFNERLHVGAGFADEQGSTFTRRVLGPDEDGTAEHEFVVPAQSTARRLQVTASILDQKGIRRDFECNDPTAGRTCAEAAAIIPRGLPEVRTRLSRGVLRIAVLDRRRIPGLLAVRATRRGRDIFATRTRVETKVFRTRVRLAPRCAQGSSGKRRDAVCVAAAYGSEVPKCERSAMDETVVRIYPTRAQFG